MYLLNGESKHWIDVSDRGFQYGDGLFETIEVIDETPVFFEQHLQRLNKGCERLLIPKQDNETLKKEAFKLAEGSAKAVLKLNITRGSGGRGYRQPDLIEPTRLFSLHPYPNYPDSFYQQGICSRYCQTPLGLNPLLAGIKHMNRLEQVLARAEWSGDDIQEGLMMDFHGHVVEGTMTNLFTLKDDILYTPPIIQCGIEGVMRNIVIQLAEQYQLSVVQKNLFQQDVETADELFVTNSIIGVWPIKQLNTHQFAVGPWTQKLQAWLSEFKQQQHYDN